MRATGAARTPGKNTSARAKRERGRNGLQLIVAANWTTVVLYVIHAHAQNSARRIGAKSMSSTALRDRATFGLPRAKATLKVSVSSIRYGLEI